MSNQLVLAAIVSIATPLGIEPLSVADMCLARLTVNVSSAAIKLLLSIKCLQ